MGNANQSSVDPGLMGRMVKKLEEVQMSYSESTGQQVEAVMTALCKSDSRLKKLAILGSHKKKRISYGFLP